jgi:hypothetical protein
MLSTLPALHYEPAPAVLQKKSGASTFGKMAVVAVV